jgi:hypothetical protein
VRRELLVRADQLAEPRMILVERLEANAFRRALDLDPALADVRDRGDVDVQQAR